MEKATSIKAGSKSGAIPRAESSSWSRWKDLRVGNRIVKIFNLWRLIYCLLNADSSTEVIAVHDRLPSGLSTIDTEIVKSYSRFLRHSRYHALWGGPR